MSIVVYVWVFMILFGISTCLIIHLVEKYVNETHPFKKWWRKHIIDRHPDER